MYIVLYTAYHHRATCTLYYTQLIIDRRATLYIQYLHSYHHRATCTLYYTQLIIDGRATLYIQYLHSYHHRAIYTHSYSTCIRVRGSCGCSTTRAIGSPQRGPRNTLDCPQTHSLHMHRHESGSCLACSRHSCGPCSWSGHINSGAETRLKLPIVLDVSRMYIHTHLFSISPLSLSSRRRVSSREEARIQLPSREKLTLVTGSRVSEQEQTLTLYL